MVNVGDVSHINGSANRQRLVFLLVPPPVATLPCHRVAINFQSQNVLRLRFESTGNVKWQDDHSIQPHECKGRPLVDELPRALVYFQNPVCRLLVFLFLFPLCLVGVFLLLRLRGTILLFALLLRELHDLHLLTAQFPARQPPELVRSDTQTENEGPHYSLLVLAFPGGLPHPNNQLLRLLCLKSNVRRPSLKLARFQLHREELLVFDNS
mmetsp:Transcript_12003/g.33834  ORF Transcript_12003/g.33834 Transcript_12003/m.33834 type:complete len:210 (+) Transcript_12003:1277-1906(+)